MIDSAVAFALGIAGVGCLYGSWRDLLSASLRPAWVGWLLLVAAGYFAVRASGAEFGSTFIFLAPALVAWLLVAANTELREAKARKRKNAERAEPTAAVGGRTLTRHLLLFVITVPLSAVAATLFSVALARTLPWSDLSEMAFALTIMPFAWGCAAYWAVADSKLARPALSILALGLLGAVSTFLLPA